MGGSIGLLLLQGRRQPYDDELPYCAAKADVLALAKGLSQSCASEGLLINYVSPTFLHASMTDVMMIKRADQRGTDVDEEISSFLHEEGRTSS